MATPQRTVDLRRANRHTLLRHLYFHAPISRLDLSQQVGLSPATVTNVVGELLEEGIIRESGSEESEGGRPRTILAINAQHGYFVGVDVGETHVQLELFDLTMRPQSTVRYLIAPGDDAPAKYVAHISDGVQALLSKTNIAPEQLLGVGIGVPGTVERSGAVSAPHWRWESVPLLTMLEARIPFAIGLDNGAKTMTLAEAWFGAGRGVQNLVVLLIGTGIGAGIITQGALYRGATNSAGEWGHTKIVLDGRPCRCGSKGCLEAYAGAPGIIASVRDLAPASPLLAFDSELSVLSNVMAAAEQGDPVAMEVVQATAHYLGAGVANLLNLFNPELILIGGWVGLQMAKTALNDIDAHARRYALPASRTAARLELCQLGQDAICMGAACLVLQGFLAGEQKFNRQPVKTISGSL